MTRVLFIIDDDEFMRTSTSVSNKKSISLRVFVRT